MEKGDAIRIFKMFMQKKKSYIENFNWLCSFNHLSACNVIEEADKKETKKLIYFFFSKIFYYQQKKSVLFPHQHSSDHRRG